MWSVSNQTPYKADGTWGRDKDGVHEWIVAVAGTFDIRRDGTVALAEEQREPLLVPEYHGEDGLSSLRYDADLVGPKPTTDVMVNRYGLRAEWPADNRIHGVAAGSGHQQDSQGQWATGHGGWPSGRTSAAEPITQVPIVYERAYGGMRSCPIPIHRSIYSTRETRPAAGW